MDNNNSVSRIPMDPGERAAIVIGLGFLALVLAIFLADLVTMNGVNDFLMVWTAVGPIVGVVVGSMPAYFFRADAKNANARADDMAKSMAGMTDDSRATGAG